MLPEERLQIRRLEKKTGELRAEDALVIHRIDKVDTVYYNLIIKGGGAYDAYEDIEWIKTAQVKEESDRLRVLESTTTLRRKDKSLIRQKKKVFDYEDSVVRYTETGPDGDVVRERTFPIQGPVCDDVTLGVFLKRYSVNLGREKYRRFYLVTGEPKQYEVMVRDKGVETIAIPAGTFSARKLQLIGDVGPLTELAKEFVPATYSWYHTEKPYTWLMYEGMEAGYQTPVIQTVVVERDPRLNKVSKEFKK